MDSLTSLLALLAAAIGGGFLMTKVLNNNNTKPSNNSAEVQKLEVSKEDVLAQIKALEDGIKKMKEQKPVVPQPTTPKEIEDIWNEKIFKSNSDTSNK
jgi:hypothetical protein